MADVVLVFPSTGLSRQEDRMLPLSVLMIASPLEAAGYQVKVIDQRDNDRWQEELARELLSPELAMLGISSMTGPQILGGLAAAQLAKRNAPAIPAVWGGVHPTLLPQETASHPLVDIVVVGEGEWTTLELVKALKEKRSLGQVAGLCYRSSDGVHTTAVPAPIDFGALPEPAYHLVDVEQYVVAPLRTEQKSLAFLTSRGCPFRCGYCYNVGFNNSSWRALSAEEVVRRMLSMKERFGLTGVYLLDDNFFVDIERVRKICLMLIESRADLAIHNANCRADAIVRLTDETLTMLKQAGFTQLFVGAESGSPEVLRQMKKDVTVEQILEANRKLKKHGIRPYFAFMAGFPFEGTSDVKMTLSLMRRLLDENPAALVPKLALLSPFPGTEILNACIECGLRKPGTLEEWAKWHHANYSSLSKCSSSFLRKALMVSYFIDPKCIELHNPVWRKIGIAYSLLIQARARNGFYLAMPELTLVRIAWRLREVVKSRRLGRTQLPKKHYALAAQDVWGTSQSQCRKQEEWVRR